MPGRCVAAAHRPMFGGRLAGHLGRSVAVGALLLVTTAGPVGAHPGGLDSAGCHAGSRPYHCHNGTSPSTGVPAGPGSSSTSEPAAPAPPPEPAAEIGDVEVVQGTPDEPFTTLMVTASDAFSVGALATLPDGQRASGSDDGEVGGVFPVRLLLPNGTHQVQVTALGRDGDDVSSVRVDVSVPAVSEPVAWLMDHEQGDRSRTISVSAPAGSQWVLEGDGDVWEREPRSGLVEFRVSGDEGLGPLALAGVDVSGRSIPLLADGRVPGVRAVRLAVRMVDRAIDVDAPDAVGLVLLAAALADDGVDLSQYDGPVPLAELGLPPGEQELRVVATSVDGIESVETLTVTVEGGDAAPGPDTEEGGDGPGWMLLVLAMGGGLWWMLLRGRDQTERGGRRDGPALAPRPAPLPPPTGPNLAPPSSVPAEPAVAATLPPPMGTPLVVDAPLSGQDALVHRVVREHGPVLLPVLVRMVADEQGVGRLSSSVRTQLEELVHDGVQAGQLVATPDTARPQLLVVGPPQGRAAQLPRARSGRTVDEVPGVELAAAAGVRGDLETRVRRVQRWLGLSRLTAATRRTIEAAVLADG